MRESGGRGKNFFTKKFFPLPPYPHPLSPKTFDRARQAVTKPDNLAKGLLLTLFKNDTAEKRNSLGRTAVIHGTALISVMGVSAILPVLPLMREHFALGKAELGLLISAFTIPGIFLAPVGGILADRFGRKFVLVPALILFALAGCACSLADSLGALLVMRFLQGCSASCFGVLYNIIISDIFSDESARLKSMGYAAASLSMGTAVYPAVGGLLGEWSWRLPFVLTLLALPLAWIVWKTVLPSPNGRGKSMAAYAVEARKNLLKPFTIGHYALTLLAFFILYGPLVTYFPLLAHDTHDASPGNIGAIFMLSSLGTVGAALALTRLAGIFSRRVIIVCGGVSFAAAMFLMPLVNDLWLYVLPIFLYGLGQGLAYPAVLASLSSLAPLEGRGVLMAVNGSVLRLAQSISPLLCGAAFAVCSFSGVFGLGFIAACGIAALAWRLFGKNAPTK